MMSQAPSSTPGNLQQLPHRLEGLCIGRFLLVCDRMAFESSGAEHFFTTQMAGSPHRCFSEFETNPKLDHIRAGLQAYASDDFQGIVSVGGGTAMDIAKLIGIGAAHPHKLEPIILGNAPVERSGPPHIAVPTTAGTGSEATQFAVVYVNGKKYSVDHPYLLPTDTLLDPELTYSLPRLQTAATACDTLAQSIESLWSVRSTAASRRDAGEALRTLWPIMNTLITHPTHAARADALWAAHLAGRAINVSRTTACHALSYHLTSAYGVPHGLAAALTLGRFLEFNAELDTRDCADERGPEHVRGVIQQICEILQADSPSLARKALSDRFAKWQLDHTPHQLGVQTQSQYAAWIGSVNHQRLANNPRRADPDQLLALVSAP